MLVNCVGKHYTLYQDKLTTDKKPTVGYSIPDEIPTTCKIYVFTSNIMVLHYKCLKLSKKVYRYTNIYLFMNLFKISQFILTFPCISPFLSVIQQKKFFNHFVFLLLLIV